MKRSIKLDDKLLSSEANRAFIEAYAAYEDPNAVFPRAMLDKVKRCSHVPVGSGAPDVVHCSQCNAYVLTLSLNPSILPV